MACAVFVGLGVAVDSRARLSDDEESSDDDEREALDVRGVAVRVGLGGDADGKGSFVGVEDSGGPSSGRGGPGGGRLAPCLRRWSCGRAIGGR